MTGKHPNENTNVPDFHTVIIGAGPGGICAAVRLLEANLDDFVILERADDFGGSWRDNHYPGIGVDVPGLTYQYSFARNANWSRVFPKGDEVLHYHQAVAKRFGLYERISFGVTVVREVWDDAHQRWILHGDDGTVLTARFVISAIGAYITPKDDPGIEGYESFQGKVLRPASWDHDYPLEGKRVAVVGTGASSVQITPAIAPLVEQLDVYQRTPVWCLPKPDLKMRPWMQQIMRFPGLMAALSGAALMGVEVGLRTVYQTPPWLFRPGAHGFDAAGRAIYRAYLGLVVKDAGARRALAPSYGVLGKRPTLSNTFLRAFNRDNVTLHTSAIERIGESSVWTADGVEHPVDAIVLATGYTLFSDPESYVEGAVVGRNGFDLGTFYNKESLQAYESVSVPGLPNRWMLVGPYSWTGTGWHALVEISSGHAVNVIVEATRNGHAVAEVSAEAHTAYHSMIKRQGANIAYYFGDLNAGIRTYYVNSQGDMPYIRPTSLLKARRSSKHVAFTDYMFTPDTHRIGVLDPQQTNLTESKATA